MPWVSAVGAVVGAVANKALAPSSSGSAASTADPFASQRPQYQSDLSNLISSGNSAQGGSTSTIQQMQSLLQGGAAGDAALTDSAGYQFALSQGTQAIDRSAAANGYLGSTQEMAQLTQFGQGLATNTLSSELTDLGNLSNQQSANYGNQYQQLAALSGANVGSPATAAQIQAQQSGQVGALATQAYKEYTASQPSQTAAWNASYGNTYANDTGYGYYANNSTPVQDPATIEGYGVP